MDFDLSREVYEAFSLRDAPRLSEEDTSRRAQDCLIAEISETGGRNDLVMELLRDLKAHTLTHYHHSLRVGVMFRVLTTLEPDLEGNISPYTLNVVGSLHDVGKINTPHEILDKPGKLTPTEEAVMQAHNRTAYASPTMQFLQSNFFPHLCEIAIRHHPYPRGGGERRGADRRYLELMDEPGQRSGLDRRVEERREENPYINRAGSVLLRIADVYDSLGSRRGYKEPKPQGVSNGILLEMFPEEREIIEYLFKMFPVPNVEEA